MLFRSHSRSEWHGFYSFHSLACVPLWPPLRRSPILACLFIICVFVCASFGARFVSRARTHTQAHSHGSLCIALQSECDGGKKCTRSHERSHAHNSLGFDSAVPSQITIAIFVLYAYNQSNISDIVFFVLLPCLGGAAAVPRCIGLLVV